jgi:hypothetical protein
MERFEHVHSQVKRRVSCCVDTDGFTKILLLNGLYWLAFVQQKNDGPRAAFIRIDTVRKHFAVAIYSSNDSCLNDRY